jgi:hypothetical protein
MQRFLLLPPAWQSEVVKFQLLGDRLEVRAAVEELGDADVRELLGRRRRPLSFSLGVLQLDQWRRLYRLTASSGARRGS